PYHSADSYIAKLIRHGLRVAICDQVEDPAAAKGLVKREIVRIVTPGTATESSIVERESCYLLSLVPNEQSLGAAYLDVSTGDFFVTTYKNMADARLGDDVARFDPREAIFPRDDNGFAGHVAELGLAATPVEPSLFEPRGAHDYLAKHFATQSLRGFGLEGDEARISAAGAALRYASASHKRTLDHVQALRVDNAADFLQLDAATLANLEVLDSRDAGRPRASLWSVINCTRTAMGARTLRRWLTRPLVTRDAIFERHDAVDELTRSRAILEQMNARLARIADLERLVSRITLRSATPRECLTLAESLLSVGELAEAMTPLQGPLLAGLRQVWDRHSCLSVIDRIAATISDTPPMNVRDGGAIKPG